MEHSIIVESRVMPSYPVLPLGDVQFFFSTASE
uniref:Uncharacterized protein n=1 Tax=Anguilla anguilla TaxID=7936 RepID=A0A0E9RM15_ANGAN